MSTDPFQEIPKVGQDFGLTAPVTFELVLSDFVKLVNPADYNLETKPIDPEYFFITSGDATMKAKELEKRLLVQAKSVNTISDSEKNFVHDLYSLIGRVRNLIHELEFCRGTAVFLETEWVNHRLYVTAKNPRVRSPEPSEPA